LRLKHDGGQNPERAPDKPTPEPLFSDEGGSADLPICRSFHINPLNKDTSEVNAESSAERQNGRSSEDTPTAPSGDREGFGDGLGDGFGDGFVATVEALRDLFEPEPALESAEPALESEPNPTLRTCPFCGHPLSNRVCPNCWAEFG